MRDVIFGKNILQNVVSIEVDNGKAVIFTEKAGIVSCQEFPHKFWLLSNERLDLTWVALKGDQHYKFGKQFDTFFKMRNEQDRWQGKDFYCIRNAVEALQIKDGYSYYKGSEIGDISILSFDIETNGLLQNDDSRVFLISNTMRINGEIKRKLFSHEDYSTDGEMIEDWCNWVRKVDPSIMCGHNIYCFDLPYLNHVAKLHDKALYLGRNESKAKFSPFESKFRVDGSRDLHYHKVQIYGREIADTMFLAYRYDIGRKYESYGLKYIIKYEGLEKTGRTFYEAGTIKDNVGNPVEWAKIKQYAEEDGDDALTLFDLMAPPLFYMAQMIPKPFQLIIESASGSQLNSLMVRSYLQNKHSIPKADEAIEYEGAISFGEPGVYKNAVSLDIASLYPSVMLQYDIHSAKKDPEGNMIKLLNYLRDQRLANKKLAKETGLDKYKHLDLSQKLMINSMYGFLGASGLAYNYPEGAAEVTRKGREILLQSMDWAKSKGFVVPKGDTDSITVYNNGESLNNDEIKGLITEINGILPEYINFELDAVYDVIVVFKAKNYAYREGEKISTKGSALKAATKCEKLKKFNNLVIKDLLYMKDHAHFQETYKQHVQEIMNIKDIKPWSMRKTLSSTMQESERTNETKVMDALKGSNYTEGDRMFMYYRVDDSLCLAENFDGEYNRTRLLKNLYDTISVFDTVLPVKDLFSNYALKRNLKLLEQL